MTSLAALIEKLRGLNGPDREVDAMIAQAFGDVYGLHGYADEEVEIARRYTASLDAVVALIEREMPNGWWRVDDDCNDDRTKARAEVGTHQSQEPKGFYANTPTLALLLAFLTAKMEMKDD